MGALGFGLRALVALYALILFLVPMTVYAQQQLFTPSSPETFAEPGPPDVRMTEEVNDEQTRSGIGASRIVGTRVAPNGDTPQPAVMRLKQSLGRFIAGRPDINLRNASATADVNIPIPAAWEPVQLLLRIKYRNSVNLLEAHSQLRVELNGLIIAQFKLDPNRPDGEARIRLPVELLDVGYNQLRFSVAQHTIIGECEDPLAPELWTQVDAVNSSLTLDYRKRAVARTLSEVDDFFGKYAWDQATLRIVMDLSAGPPAPEKLEWGALVAQGAAIRVEYRSLNVELQGLDNLETLATTNTLFANAPDALVLIGTAAELRPRLGDEWAMGVTDSYLGLLPGNTEDASSLEQLVVSGKTPDQVKRAAIALGLINLPLPDSPEALIGELELPTLPLNTGQRALLGGAVARFDELGIQTTTLGSALAPSSRFSSTGTAGHSAETLKTTIGLDFWVPAGFYPGRYQQGLIVLDFSYGAKLRGDSVLNLDLNGVFVRGIPLDNPEGATQIGYQVRFPFDLLTAGRNRLEITPNMVPSFTDLCQLRQGENLRFTLFGGSGLMIPDVERLVALPDLSAFSRAGFPLLNDPAGGELGVQLAGNNPRTISAAWTVLGRLAQLVQLPLYRAEIGYEAYPDKFSWLVVGPFSAISPELRARSPIAVRDGLSWVDYPVLDLIEPLAPKGNWAERGLARLQRWIDPPPGGLRSLEAHVGFVDEVQETTSLGTLFGSQAGLFEFQSPANAGATVVMLTAGTPKLLQERAARLVQPDFWYNLSGGFALWGDQDDSLKTQRVKQRFTVGQAGPLNRANFLLNTYPQALLATVLFLILLLVSLLFAVTRWFRRRPGASHPEKE